MKQFTLSACCLNLILMIGCATVPVENGKLPISHATKLKDIAGVYSGKMNLATKDNRMHKPHIEQLSLKLDISDAGIMSVNFSEEWLGKTCDIKVGKLVEFHALNQQDSANFEASFEFDPGKCPERITPDFPMFILISNRDNATGVRIETYLSREYIGISSKLRGRSTLYYYGVFFKEKS